MLGGWKTGNYWPHVQALAAARKNGFDEVLVLNIEGAVISASMANVFLRSAECCAHRRLVSVHDRGVIRAWIKEMTPVEESLLSLEDIETADECFLTNSRIGVMPVAEIEGRRLPSRSSRRGLGGVVP